MIDNWHIPKLELLQSVILTVRLNGAPCQRSADLTESAHIDVVKEPIRSGNNQAQESQICQHLDCLEKVWNFTLGTSICDIGVQFRAPFSEEKEEEKKDEMALQEDVIISTTTELLPFLWTTGYHAGTPQIIDYFYHANLIKRGLLKQMELCPPRTFQSSKNIVYHLSHDPSYRKMIADTAQLYYIPDLPAAIGSFILQASNDPTNSHIDSIG